MEREYQTTKENLKELGLKLKKKRLRLNLTQLDISEKTGINRSTLSQIENGSNFSLKYLIMLFKTYGLLDEFIDLIVVPEISPIELFKLKSKQRQRASKKK